jgi:hypothetical protein
MQNGWIKIHRKLLEKGYWRKSAYAHLWIHLLLTANHQQKEFMWNNKIIHIKEGQILTGRKELSKQTGISETTIENILKMLENEHQIGQQKTTKFRIITIINWKEYQKLDTKTDNGRTTNGQQTDTNKNDKKEKNDKNKNNAPANADIDNLLNEKGGIQYDYQYQGLEIYEKTGAPKDKKAECIRLAKNYPKLINPALSFCLDYPNQALKWKMFLWKLNQLIKDVKKS